MTVLPNNREEQIVFCETHNDTWESNFAAIGLASDMVTLLKARTVAARGALDAALEARLASKTATSEYYNAVALMRTQAALCIDLIKAHAAQQPNPAVVYNLAQIPLPSPPSPLPAVGKPEDFIITLQPSGAVTLSWTADNAAASSGAFFEVTRKLPGQTAFVGIGGAPGATNRDRRMAFTDQSLPSTSAASGAQYIVRGRRGEDWGLPSDVVLVQFGFDAAGNMTSATLQMAA
ncbi:MAG: fibronectin type III domain-containing protein [Phycisphaerales bacterium]